MVYSSVLRERLQSSKALRAIRSRISTYSEPTPDLVIGADSFTLAEETRYLSTKGELRMATEAKEGDSREDTLGGFSGIRGRKSRRAFHNERSSQYVVTRRLTLPRPRARRVDNRFREGTTATVLVLPPLWTMFERRRHSGNQVDSQSAHFPHRDRSPTSLHKGNLFHD